MTNVVHIIIFCTLSAFKYIESSMLFRKISQCQVRLNAHGADTYRLRQIGGNVQNLRPDLCHQTAKVGFPDHGIIDAEALSEISNMRTGHQSYGYADGEGSDDYRIDLATL